MPFLFEGTRKMDHPFDSAQGGTKEGREGNQNGRYRLALVRGPDAAFVRFVSCFVPP